MIDDEGACSARAAPPARRRARHRRRRQPVHVAAVLPGRPARRRRRRRAGQDGRAWFTNFGGWVDACAPAIDVVSTFFVVYEQVTTPKCSTRRRSAAGRAGAARASPRRRSPPSIAQEMYLTGSTAHDVMERLSYYQRYRFPTSAPCSTSDAWRSTSTSTGPLGVVGPSSRAGASRSPPTSRARVPDPARLGGRRVDDERRRPCTTPCARRTSRSSARGGRGADERHARCAASARTGGRRRPMARWRTGEVVALVDRLADALPSARTTCTSPTASARHFGIVGVERLGRHPGRHADGADRDALDGAAGGRARSLREPLALPWRRPPNVLVLDTGLATATGQPAHDALQGHCIMHRPWLDRATPALQRRGRARRRRPRPARPPGRPRHVHLRRDPPDLPRRAIHHAGVLSSYGDGDDASVTSAIERALRRFRQRNEHIDIVVMSFGSYAEDDRPPPMATRSAGSCGAASSSPRRATTRRRGRASRRRSPGWSASGRWTPTGAACSPTSVRGSTPRRRASTSSARSSPTSTTPMRRRVRRPLPRAGRRGAARASPPRRSAAAIAQPMYLRDPHRPGGVGAPAPRPRRSAIPDLGVLFNV